MHTYLKPLYFVSLGKKPGNDHIHMANLGGRKVLGYTSLYQRTGLDKLIGEIL